MQNFKYSRRAFLSASALLTISGIITLPAVSIAQLMKEEALPSTDQKQHYNDVNPTSDLYHRSDIRSLDFDSHHFLLNFRY